MDPGYIQDFTYCETLNAPMFIPSIVALFTHVIIPMSLSIYIEKNLYPKEIKVKSSNGLNEARVPDGTLCESISHTWSFFSSRIVIIIGNLLIISYFHTCFKIEIVETVPIFAFLWIFVVFTISIAQVNVRDVYLSGKTLRICPEKWSKYGIVYVKEHVKTAHRTLAAIFFTTMLILTCLLTGYYYIVNDLTKSVGIILIILTTLAFLLMFSSLFFVHSEDSPKWNSWTSHFERMFVILVIITVAGTPLKIIL